MRGRSSPSVLSAWASPSSAIAPAISGLNFAVNLIRCSSSVPTSIPCPPVAGSTVRSVYGQALPSSKGFSAIAGDRRGASLSSIGLTRRALALAEACTGSSAFVGALEVDEVRGARRSRRSERRRGTGRSGYIARLIGGRRPRLERIAAYLELHIEQGPILVEAGEPVASVTGTVGIQRDCISFEGQSAHAGPTPMEGRADAFLPAAEVAVALEELARRSGGRATNGRLDLEPGVPTATAGRADLFTDLRHENPEALEQMHVEAGQIAEARASARGVKVTRRKIWSIEPRAFDSRPVDAAREACVASGGSDFTMPSGALHDAGELAPLVPTAMIFCASQRGLSHCPEEDSTEEDLECAIRAFDRLARSVAERSDLP